MTIANEFHFLFVVEFRFLLVNMCWVFSLSSMISKSHFSFYLLLFLSLFPFQAKKYLVFAIQAFSLVDFSLSFCSFPSNQSPDESESPNRQTKELRQMVSSNHSVNNGWEICSLDLSGSSDGLTPNPICSTSGEP